ncbi:MAG: alpha/beta fold hydrolase [Pseudomonadota bacterium]
MLRIPLLALALLSSSPTHATPVGEIHRVALNESATLRDQEHRPQILVTIWYPASDGTPEQPITIGPPGQPMFTIGATASGPAFAGDAPGVKRPVILLSHGFGGSARMMGWFGIELARAGYVVISVDHPGNNGRDPMTVAGALLTWLRASDLRAALGVALADPGVGPHIDTSRVGLAGFSAGGFTALVLGGARAAPQRLLAFCKTNPNDGVCKPQVEFSVDAKQRDALLADPAYADAIRHAGDDQTIPHVKAIVVMAPAVIQGLDPASLKTLATPVSIILGDQDVVAPPITNGKVAAALLPNARLEVLPGVGHYDFLANCTANGPANLCGLARHQSEAHQAALAAAIKTFGQALKAQP